MNGHNTCSFHLYNNHSTFDSSRRKLLEKAPTIVTVGSTLIFYNPQEVWSRNLPDSTGADFSGTGSIAKLVPILKIRSSLFKAQETLLNGGSLSNDEILNEVIVCLRSIPKDEVKFKRIFDEYSDPVSYKQKYMDSNAFLVYYTKGFDGPGRESIEKDIPKQTLQYGARNDVWTSFDELLLEIKFADGETSMKEILLPLNTTLKNIDTYLNLAPKEDVEMANNSLELR